MSELFVKEVLAITVVVLFVEIFVLATFLTIDTIVDIIRRIWRG